MKSIKGITFTAATMAVPLVVGVISVPFYLEKIGAERYGALAIAWLLLGYFAQADFGVGRAVTQRISVMRRDEGGGGDASKLIWTAFALAGCIGVISAIVLYFAAGYFFTELFRIDRGLVAELQASLLLLAISGPVVNIFSVAVGALLGVERVRTVALLNLGNGLTLQLFPLFAAYLIDVDMWTLIAAALAARAIMTVPACALVWRTLLAGSAVRTGQAELKRLANFGAWIMVTSIVGPFMVISDRFVIGAVAGAVAVAAYTIPFQIASRTMIVPYAIMQVLFPQLAGLEGAEARNRAEQALVALGTMFAPVPIVLICLAEPLLILWLGDNLDPRSVLIGQIVLVGWWVNSLAQVPFGLIQAQGNPRFTAILHVVELPLYVALLWVFGIRFGLAGMAAAFALRCLVDFLVLAWKARVLTFPVFQKLAPTAALIALALVGVAVSGAGSMRMAVAAVLGVGAFLWAWHALPSDVRSRLLATLLVWRRA